MGVPSQTALLVAVTANQAEIVQDLLSLGADINACDVNGQTALHLAAHYGFPAALQVENQRKQKVGQTASLTARLTWGSYAFPPQAVLSSRPAVNLETRNFEGKDAMLDTGSKKTTTKKLHISTQVSSLTFQLPAHLRYDSPSLRRHLPQCNHEGFKRQRSAGHRAAEEGCRQAGLCTDAPRQRCFLAQSGRPILREQ